MTTYTESRRRRATSGVEIAGQLTERVSLFGVALTDDGHGGVVEAPVPLVPGEVFALVESLQGTERFQALVLEVAVLYLVTIRYHAQVTAGTFLTWAGRTLQVQGPPVELVRRELLQLYCAERSA